jgi:cellulose biosynthesis protein BcsQ
MPARIATFYSYKGGVGRSFAVANIAVILAQWGNRVLAVDWDIEAPGLNFYFSGFSGPHAAGVLDFLDDCKKDSPRPWSTYASQLHVTGVEGELYLMPASGDSGTDYTNFVQQLDWDELYDKHALGTRLEQLRTEWQNEFDFVLIDSRTGVTDFSGITTAQLPDILAFMFTANEQSLKGCASIARRAMEARRRMPVDRPALSPLPIPARFKQREEYDRAQSWRFRFATELSPFLDVWAPRGVDTLKLIDLLTIPYVPRWTFGEDMAALLEPAGSSGTRTTGQAVSYACETLAALLMQGFSQVDLLVSSRDEYVHGARSISQERKTHRAGTVNIFLSYSGEAGVAQRLIASYLQNTIGEGIRIFSPEVLEPGDKWAEAIQTEIERANAYLVIFGPSASSGWQAREIEQIARQSLRGSQVKPIIPIVLRGAEAALAKSRLANYNAVIVDLEQDLDDQLAPVVSSLRHFLAPEDKDPERGVFL